MVTYRTEPVVIALKDLEAKGACHEGLSHFHRRFGYELSIQDVDQAKRLATHYEFDYTWCSNNILSAAQKSRYTAVLADLKYMRSPHGWQESRAMAFAEALFMSDHDIKEYEEADMMEKINYRRSPPLLSNDYRWIL